MAALSAAVAYPTSALNMWEEMEHNAALLPTVCNHCRLDALLDGGVITGELLEITGPPASGKTQFSMTMAMQVITDTKFSVVFLDATNGFSAHRCKEILVNRGTREEDVAEMLRRARVYSVHTLFDALSILTLLKENVARQSDSFHSALRLVIIDGVSLLVAPLLDAKQSQGHAMMTHLAAMVKSLAHDHSIAAVCTNSMVADMSSASLLKPALGKTWSHVPHVRVALETCTSSGLHVATLLKSSRQPTGIAVSFLINQKGLDST
ncbi:hypothetical protein EMCRGX_G025047 [Ephydatia muelleri]